MYRLKLNLEDKAAPRWLILSPDGKAVDGSEHAVDALEILGEYNTFGKCLDS